MGATLSLKLIVASRGRMKNGKWVQQMEIRKDRLTNTITSVTKDNLVMELRRIANIYGDDKGTGFAGNVWDRYGLSPTIQTSQGGLRQPLVIVKTDQNESNSIRQHTENR